MHLYNIAVNFHFLRSLRMQSIISESEANNFSETHQEKKNDNLSDRDKSRESDSRVGSKKTITRATVTIAAVAASTH